MSITFSESMTRLGRAIAFLGQDGDRTIHCFVTREALEDATRATNLDRGGLRAAFQTYVQTIRRAAEQKYAAGSIESDGAVIVVSLDLSG